MTHLEKYQLIKVAGIGDWMPDATFDITPSTGIMSDIGNFGKGIVNSFVDPVVGTVKHTLQGDWRKALGSAGLAALTFLPGGKAVAGAKGVSTAGMTAKQINALKSTVGMGKGLKGMFNVANPTWWRGMRAGWFGSPLRTLGTMGLAGGFGALGGRLGAAGPGEPSWGTMGTGLAGMGGLLGAAARGGGVGIPWAKSKWINSEKMMKPI